MRNGARRRREASSGEEDQKHAAYTDISFFCLYHSLTAGNTGWVRLESGEAGNLWVKETWAR